MKIEQTLREALRIFIKIWPYGVLQLAFNLVVIVLSQTSENIFLLCLMLPLTLLTYLVGILFYRVMFYAMDDKDLHFSSVSEGLARPAGRVLALSIVSTIVIGILFFVISLVASFFLAIVLRGAPELQAAGVILALLVSGIFLLPLLLLLAVYSPLIMGSIIDRDQGVRASLREAHTLVKAHWKKLLVWVLLLTVPNTLIGMLVGALAQGATNMSLAGVLIYLVAYIAVTLLGLFAQTSWAVIYRQLSRPEAPTKPRRARVSS